MELPDRPTVIHVVERTQDAAAEFDRAIAQAGCRTERVETVYGALARLVRPADRSVLAVIVCVDALAGPELEFFVLAAQRCPDVPVYVYGRSDSGDRRQRACALGAQSDVSADHVATVLTGLDRARSDELVSAPRPTPPTPVPVEEPPVAETPEPAPPQEETTVDRIETASDTAPVAPEPATPDQSRTVNVPTPWQPAGGRPQRIPPGARSGAAGKTADDRESSQDAASRQPETADEPLLTRQEVDALMSKPASTEEPGKSSDDGPDE